MSKASNHPAWWPTPEHKLHADAGCAHPDECKVASTDPMLHADIRHDPDCPVAPVHASADCTCRVEVSR